MPVLPGPRAAQSFYHCEVGYDFAAQIFAASSFYGVPCADGSTTLTYLRTVIPPGISGTARVRVLAVALASGNLYCQFNAIWGQIGEAPDTHSYSGSYGAVAMTADVNTVVADLSLSNVDAGDIVHITFIRDATAGGDTISGIVQVVGVLIE